MFGRAPENNFWPSLVFAHSNSAAFATEPSSIVEICVRIVERMSNSAMCFISIVAARFSTANVLWIGNRFEMRRSNAPANTTEVVQFQAVRNRSVLKNVSETVRSHHQFWIGTEFELAVASIRTASGPEPARSEVRAALRNWAILVDFFPEANCWWRPRVGAWHSRILSRLDVF